MPTVSMSVSVDKSGLSLQQLRAGIVLRLSGIYILLHPSASLLALQWQIKRSSCHQRREFVSTAVPPCLFSFTLIFPVWISQLEWSAPIVLHAETYTYHSDIHHVQVKRNRFWGETYHSFLLVQLLGHLLPYCNSLLQGLG